MSRDLFFLFIIFSRAPDFVHKRRIDFPPENSLSCWITSVKNIGNKWETFLHRNFFKYLVWTLLVIQFKQTD